MKVIKLPNNEMLSIANKITETIDRYYSLNNITHKIDIGYVSVECEVGFSETEKFGTVVSINTNIPFPLVDITIREFHDDDENNLNFFDSNVVITLYRNEQTVAIYNSAFSGYEKHILSFVEQIVDCYKTHGYDSTDEFKVK